MVPNSDLLAADRPTMTSLWPTNLSCSAVNLKVKTSRSKTFIELPTADWVHSLFPWKSSSIYLNNSEEKKLYDSTLVEQTPNNRIFIGMITATSWAFFSILYPISCAYLVRSLMEVPRYWFSHLTNADPCSLRRGYVRIGQKQHFRNVNHMLLIELAS